MSEHQQHAGSSSSSSSSEQQHKRKREDEDDTTNREEGEEESTLNHRIPCSYKITNTKTLNIIKTIFKLSNVERDVRTFDCIDPFNKSNTIKGCIVTKHGKYNGSMIIDNINNVELNEPNIVYNIPNLNYLYPKKQKKGTCFLPENYFKNIKNFNYFCFMNKWNGSNIVLYKYSNNDGIEFISAKTKGTPIVENNPKYSILFYDLTVKSLQKLNLYENETIVKTSNNIYFNYFINEKKINSLSCELCGHEEPHLVSYNFDIELKPLLFLYNDSKIKPCILESINGFNNITINTINSNENTSNEIATDNNTTNNTIITNGNEISELNNISLNKLQEYKNNYKLLIEQVKSLQEYNFNLNEQFRKENGLKHAYEYNHFITEGCVLYLLDKESFACDRNFIFKIKPNDIEQVHWENFNEKHEKLVDEALLKIELRHLELNQENLRREMDTMGEKEWSKFSSDILKYVKRRKGIDMIGQQQQHGTSSSASTIAPVNAITDSTNESSVQSSTITLTDTTSSTVDMDGGCVEEEEPQKKKVKQE